MTTTYLYTGRSIYAMRCPVPVWDDKNKLKVKECDERY